MKYFAEYDLRAISSFAKPYLIAVVVWRLSYSNLFTRVALEDSLRHKISLNNEEDILKDFSSLHLSDVP
ncbi:hypothetical protein TNCV_590892 [Trichonephila clavipes]|nr:hypothetical protein TNCV_590892 [Trichonephila clavipes]